MKRQTISGRITKRRISEVCAVSQKNIPEAVLNFSAMVLVNDLNKLGASIPIRTAKGTPRDRADLCDEIREFTPDVDGVCLIGSRGKVPSSELAYALARSMNKTLGSQILLEDREGKKRPVDHVCRDMWQVKRFVDARLSDDISDSQSRIADAIKYLKVQRDLLDTTFSDYLKTMSSGKRDADRIHRQIMATVKLQEAMNEAMEYQIKFGKDKFDQLSNLKGMLHYNLNPSVAGISAIGGAVGGAGVANIPAAVSRLMSEMSTSADIAIDTKQCLINMGVDGAKITESEKEDSSIENLTTLAKEIQSKFTEFRSSMMHGNVALLSPEKMSYVVTCMKQALDEIGIAISNKVSNLQRCASLKSKEQCEAVPDYCVYDDTAATADLKCKPITYKDQFDQLNDADKLSST